MDRSDSEESFENQEEAGVVSGQTDNKKAQTGNFQKNQLSEEAAAEKLSDKESHPVSQAPIPYSGEEDAPNPYSRVEKPVYEAVITPDVIINGDIIAGSNLKILGKVFGNVECKGSIVLSGNIEGDVSADKLRFLSGGIYGNVTVKENITAERDTCIKGDIDAGSAVLSGNVQGGLNVHENLELREMSSVVGNIKALGIAIFNGSRIKGMLDVGGDLKEMRAENEER